MPARLESELILKRLWQVHTYEELTNSFRDVSSKCHSLISDGGKEITKLLSSSNRTLKVSKGAPAWKAYVDYIGDIVIDGLVECIIASVCRLTSQVGSNIPLLSSCSFRCEYMTNQVVKLSTIIERHLCISLPCCSIATASSLKYCSDWCNASYVAHC